MGGQQCKGKQLESVWHEHAGRGWLCLVEMGMRVDLLLLCLSRKCSEMTLRQIVQYFIGHSKKIRLYQLQIFKHRCAF